MHELSIARSLVRVCEDAAREQNASRVTRVYLQLGPLSGVVREALEFAYDFATEDSLLTGSELIVEPTPLLARCERCAREVAPRAPHQLRCPECDEPTPEVISGRELLVRAIDFDQAAPPPLERDRLEDHAAQHRASARSIPSAEAATAQPYPRT